MTVYLITHNSDPRTSSENNLLASLFLILSLSNKNSSELKSPHIHVSCFYVNKYDTFHYKRNPEPAYFSRKQRLNEL